MIGIVCAFFHTEGKGFYSNICNRLLYGKKPLIVVNTCEIAIIIDQTNEYFCHTAHAAILVDDAIATKILIALSHL